jgi:hypothetical protein
MCVQKREQRFAFARAEGLLLRGCVRLRGSVCVFARLWLRVSRDAGREASVIDASLPASGSACHGQRRAREFWRRPHLQLSRSFTSSFHGAAPDAGAPCAIHVNSPINAR